MRLAATDAVVAGVAGVVLAGMVAWSLLSRRATARRLVALTARLDDEVVELAWRGRVERTLARLEQTVDTAVTSLGDARLTRDRLDRALLAVPLGVVVCDEGGEVVFYNPQASELTRVTNAEVMAQQAVMDLLAKSVDGDGHCQTLDLYGPPRRTLSITASPIDDGWRTIGAVAVIEDVSGRRRVEAVRRDFAANITHELKTPVAALGLLAESLAGEPDPDVASRLARRLQPELRRVARVVDELADLSQVESEEAPEREPVPLHLLVAQAIERARAAAEERGVVLRVADAAGTRVVLGDRRQLVSALFNLVDNAVKYSDDGSTVDVDWRDDGEWVDVTVRDHGVGIPPPEIERIFERFYRTDRGRSRDATGIGLGLAIVRHVAGSHGGEVLVESEEGEGSTFTLRLPAGPGPVMVTSARAG